MGWGKRGIAAVVVMVAGLTGACSIDFVTFAHPDASLVDSSGTDMTAQLQLVPSTSALGVNEGGQTTFTVSLTSAPPGLLSVTLASSDTDKVLVTPTSLTFDAGDFANAKQVTVSGREDTDVTNELETVTASAPGVPDISVMVTVEDNDGLGIVAMPDGLEVTEAGTTNLGIRLSAQPATNTVITVSSSDPSTATVSQTLLTFTSDNWNDLQSVILTGIDDADVSNDDVAVHLVSAGLVAVQVPLTVIDDDVLAIVPTTTNLGLLSEGGAASFGVTLTEMPPGDVVVTVSSTSSDLVAVAPESLLFNQSNWYLPQTVAVSAPDDLDEADGAATITLAADGLLTRNIAAAVEDDDTQVIVAFPVPFTIDEGSSRDLNVRLAYKPASDVTLNVSSHDATIVTVATPTVTFTPANYDTYQLISATAAEDTDAAGELTQLRLESVAANLLTDIPVAVTDDDQLSIETDQTAVSVNEAGTVQFGVRLSAMPVTSMAVSVSSGDPTAFSVMPSTLTFTTGNWNAFQMVTLTGVQDLDLDTELATVTLAAAALPAKTVDVTIVDDDMQAVLMSSATVSVNEGETATVGVTLKYMPVANVNVTVSSADTGIATSAPATLTFTPANYNTPQQLTISGVDDPDAADDTTTVDASATAAMTGSVSVTVNDTDALGISTSPTTLTIDEGDTGTFGVRLTAQPAADTVVDLASSDVGAATVSPSALTFTTVNWNTPQTVTVTTVDDDDAANASVTLSASSAGLATRNVTASIVDDETLDVITTQSSLSIVEGGMGTFEVRLSARPLVDTTVTVSSSDLAAGSASPATLTFSPSNYSMNQTVTVSGVNDVDVANESITISLTSPGIGSVPVSVSITDDDVQAVIASSSAVTVSESGATTVGFSLQYEPSGPVIVNLNVADALLASISTTSLTFTPQNYATVQQIQITGVDDANVVNAMTTLTATASGANSASVDITVTDDDTLGLAVSTSAMAIVENVGGSFGVKLTAEPMSPVTVTVASSDVTAATVAPATLSFDATDWNTYKNVVVTGTADADAASEATTVTVSSTGLVPESVSVTVTDDEVQDIVADPTALDVDESSSITFGVRLAAEPIGDRTVTVTSGDTGAATVSPATLTFTAANYATPQLVTVTGISDPDLADESVTLTLSSPNLPNRHVTAAVTDDDVQVIEAEQPSVMVTEGGSTTARIRLAFVPAGDVTVSLSSVSSAVAGVSPASLTFTPGNYAVYQDVTVSAPHDADLAAGTTSIDATADGATGATIAVTVTDDDMQAVQLSSSTLSITEGGSGTIGVKLAFAPSSNVTVTLGTGSSSIAWASPSTLTFTPGNYNEEQTVTLNAPEDLNVALDSTTLTASAGGATSGTATVSVTDNDTQIVNVSTSSLSVVEGSTGTIGFSLGFEPSANVIVTVSSASPTVATVSTTSLTFTPANYSTPQNVTVTAVQDADLIANTTTISATATGATAGSVTFTSTDNDTQVIQVGTNPVAVTEGSSTTYGITLGFVPTDNVTVSLASSDTTVVSVSPPTLTFTPANYNVSQTVTVTGVQDVDLAPDTAIVTASAPGATSGTATVNVTDNDSQVVLVNPTSINVTEGASGSFGVTLAFQPSANVTVTLTSSDSAVATPSPSTLTFTPQNYNQSQNVTVTALHDANLAPGSVSISAQAPMATQGACTVSIADDDTQIVQFSTSTVSVTEGQTATLGVRLGFVPAGDVTVSVSSNNTAAATVSPGSLTFNASNYATFQNVTITGTQDANTTADSATISGTATGATGASATVNVTDDDVQRAVVNPAALSVTEGGSTTFGVTLAFAPASNITVNVNSSDTSVATVSTSSLTFTPSNYNTSQTVTVTSVHDGDLAPGSTTIVVGGGGANNGTVVLDVTDDDMQAIQVSPTMLSMTEGGTAGFGVTLAFKPSSDVTVSLSSLDGSVATVGTSTLTFTPANYNVSQNVVVTAPQDADLIANTTTLNATAPSVLTASLGVTVSDNDTQIVQIAPGDLSVLEGETAQLQVTLGFIPPGPVTVTMASDNTAVASVTSGQTLMFTAANYNVPQTVTVSAPHDVDLVENMASITGTASGAFSGSSVVTVSDDDEQRIVMSSSTTIQEGQSQQISVRLLFKPTTDVAVTVSSDTPSKVSVPPTTLTFTPLNYNVDQTFTISAEHDVDMAPAAATITAATSGVSWPEAASAQLSVAVTDDDSQVVIVSQPTLNVTEGSSGTYTVRLMFQPAANVTVSIASNNATVATASPSSLVFTPANYNVGKTVTVNAVEDIDLITNTTQIVASAPLATSGSVTVNNTDNDTQRVVFSTSSVSITEGNTTTIGVTLAYVPVSNTTVTVSSTNTAVATASPGSLTFTSTNWNTPQNVTITAQQDSDLVSGAATINGAISGVTTASASVSVTDDDTQRVVFTPGSPSTMTITEGQTGTLNVKLAFMPSSNVTVSLSTSPTGVVTLSTSTLTFTPANYATNQAVTITANHDVNLADNTTTITGSAPGASPNATLSVTSDDEDIQNIEVTNIVTKVNEAGQSSFLVRLSYQPTGNATVSISSSDPSALTVSPSSITFTPSNYNQNVTVMVYGVQDTDKVHENVTITMTTPGAPNKTLALQQRDNDIMTVSPATLCVLLAGNGAITLSLATAPLENMTVNIIPQSGVVSASPGSWQFTTSNWNVPKTIVVTPQGIGNTDILFTHPDQTTRSVDVTVKLFGC